MATLSIGIVDELFQGILPRRFITSRDFWVNGLGEVLGLVVMWGIGGQGEWREEQKAEDTPGETLRELLRNHENLG